MFSFLNKNENLNCAYPVIKETLPKSALGYNTNNKYPIFPPLMNDSRSLTASWQPEAIINNELLKQTGIKTNWEYRKYLTDNAVSIMNHDFKEASNDNGYIRRYADSPMISQQNYINHRNPHLYNSVNDSSMPLGHSTSDLKDNYLSREQLESKRHAPSITQEEMLVFER